MLNNRKNPKALKLLSQIPLYIINIPERNFLPLGYLIILISTYHHLKGSFSVDEKFRFIKGSLKKRTDKH